MLGDSGQVVVVLDQLQVRFGQPVRCWLRQLSLEEMTAHKYNMKQTFCYLKA